MVCKRIWAAVANTLAVLDRNPDAAKGIVAVSFVNSVWNIPAVLVATDLQAIVWGEKMSQYMSMVNVASYTLSILFVGPLGRLADRLGNRFMMIVVLFLLCLPTYMLLVAGPNEFGLNLWAAARVLAGFSGITPSGCPVYYSLASEKSRPEDASVVLGIAFAFAAFSMIVFDLLGMLVQKRFPGEPRLVLGMFLLASLVALGLLLSMKPRGAGQGAGQGPQGRAGEEIGQPAEVEAGAARPEGERATPSKQPTEPPKRGCRCVLLDSLLFPCAHRHLLGLCFVAALVSIPETTLFDVQVQYYFSSLGLLGAPGPKASEERKFIAFSGMIAMQITLLLGTYAIAAASNRVKSQTMLRCMIPFTSALLVVPVLVRICPGLPTVLMSAVCLGLSLCVLPPLQAVIAAEAPEGHVSESMGAVGAYKSMASLVGNLLVTFGVPVLNSTGWENPLWTLFPLCGFIAVLSLCVWTPQPEARMANSNSRKVDVEDDDHSSLQTSADLDLSLDSKAMQQLSEVSLDSKGLREVSLDSKGLRTVSRDQLSSQSGRKSERSAQV